MLRTPVSPLFIISSIFLCSSSVAVTVGALEVFSWYSWHLGCVLVLDVFFWHLFDCLLDCQLIWGSVLHILNSMLWGPGSFFQGLSRKSAKVETDCASWPVFWLWFYCPFCHVPPWGQSAACAVLRCGLWWFHTHAAGHRMRLVFTCRRKRSFFFLDPPSPQTSIHSPSGPSFQVLDTQQFHLPLQCVGSTLRVSCLCASEEEQGPCLFSGIASWYETAKASGGPCCLIRGKEDRCPAFASIHL